MKLFKFKKIQDFDSKDVFLLMLYASVVAGALNSALDFTYLYLRSHH